MITEAKEYCAPSFQDVCRAMAFWAAPLGLLYLVDVKLANKQTGKALRPTSYQLLLEAGVRICWFAIQETEAADRILFSDLYAEKFQKLTSRWNRADSAHRFDIGAKSISAAAAASFFMTATHQQQELIRITLKHKRA